MVPGGSSQQVLGVGRCGVDRQALSSQQQLAGGHGDVLQAPDDLHLVVLFLKKKRKTNTPLGRAQTDSHTHAGTELTITPTDLSVARHLQASIQELVKVLAELSRSDCQLAAGSSGGMDHLPRRLVQLLGRLVQLVLGLLEGLGSWGDLKGKPGQV